MGTVDRMDADELARRYAEKLAADPDFVREHLEFSESYDPGAEPGLTLDQFAERYLT